MNTEPDWTLARSFLEVARRGSLSAAAREIGVTQPTVARHVEEFERKLGVALFTRSPSGLALTPDGQRLRVHAEAMEDSMAAIRRAAAEGKDETNPRGVVRITASEAMGVAVLPRILVGIRERHPDIVFELTLNNRADDLLRRSADIAIRMFQPAQVGLVARRLGELALGLFAHRRYVERFGMPTCEEDLPRYHLIGFDRDSHSAKAVAAGVLPLDREAFGFRCDHDAASMAALQAGLGVGVIQNALAADDPDLIPILPGKIRFKLAAWLVMHEDQRRQPAVRAVFDGLAEGLTVHLAKAAA